MYNKSVNNICKTDKASLRKESTLQEFVTFLELKFCGRWKANQRTIMPNSVPTFRGSLKILDERNLHLNIVKSIVLVHGNATVLQLYWTIDIGHSLFAAIYAN